MYAIRSYYDTLPIANLQRDMPAVYGQFVDICGKLEAHFREMQDVEFTRILKNSSDQRTRTTAVRALDKLRTDPARVVPIFTSYNFV